MCWLITSTQTLEWLAKLATGQSKENRFLTFFFFANKVSVSVNFRARMLNAGSFQIIKFDSFLDLFVSLKLDSFSFLKNLFITQCRLFFFENYK